MQLTDFDVLCVRGKKDREQQEKGKRQRVRERENFNCHQEQQAAEVITPQENEAERRVGG